MDLDNRFPGGGASPFCDLEQKPKREGWPTSTEKEAPMKSIARCLIAAACLSAASPALAFEREVNNVWWAVYEHYNGGDQTACIAENYNDQPVQAVFEVFPAAADFDGGPAPGRMLVTLAPYQTIKIWGWADAPGPGPRCELRGSNALP
ncbi:hypothetical protein CH337_13165 [Rhodoblastus acidophilus]|nr:hypothetical protein CKO16_20370 [Rhodoblastus acidophilus]RAI18865.1 hypothetical protein CH337_13165 [Rhodoblastus acidophilus]